MRRESVASVWCRLALMDIRLRLLPHRLNRRLLEADAPSGGPTLGENARAEVDVLLLKIAKAAKHPFLFNMSCLRQALVIRSILRAEGIGACLVYGARIGPAGFSSHAWIEAGGVAINGASSEAFQRFSK